MSHETAAKKMPKGGRKGGTRFPQIDLKRAAEYNSKLVSRTHTGPQNEGVILPGVFGSATDQGKIRASAMKQYGLLKGEAAAYDASDLAKQLNAAPEGDKKAFLQQAFFNTKIFKTLYDTFVGDAVSTAKLRQQIAQLEVHPENLDKATKIFVDSAVYAGVANVNGDSVTLLRVSAPTASGDIAGGDNGKIENDAEGQLNPSDETPDLESSEGEQEADPSPQRQGPVRAVVNVNVTLDSTLDTDKLEKQLKLLRRFGAL